MPKTASVSDESLKHWGMLAEPFTADFFFRTTPFKNLVAWLGDSVIPSNQLHLVRSKIGSGLPTAFYQIASFAGMTERAIDGELTYWTDQPISHIVDEAVNRFASGTRGMASSPSPVDKLWLIHAFRPSQVTVLRNRLARVADQLIDVSIVVRIEDNPSTRGSHDELPMFSFRRTDEDELARCVARSIRSAGATGAIFQTSAIERVVRMSKGSFNELASVTNRILAWGHLRGLTEISSQSVLECFGTEIQGRKSDDGNCYRRAA